MNKNKNRKRFAYALTAVFAASAGVADAQGASCKIRSTGEASWYGPGFDGRKTASGEIFHQNALDTAAHKTLPFDSLVQATDLETGRSIVVRINDRGPYIDGRIIDFSKGAARRFGLGKKRGTTDVSLRVLRCGA